MNTKWVGIVLLGVMVSTLSFAARTVNPSYLNGNVVGLEGYPQWNLGAAGSTWQDWNINNTGYDWSDAPTQYSNPHIKGSDLLTSITNWDDFLTVNVTVPNIQSSGKTIWFEVVYVGDLGYYDENIGIIENFVFLSTGLDSNGPITDGVKLFYNPAPIENQGWKTLTIGWTIKPSPSAEWFDFFVFGSDAQIKSISVDTLSNVVPAPGAVVLAGFGAAIVGYFRRKY